MKMFLRWELDVWFNRLRKAADGAASNMQTLSAMVELGLDLTVDEAREALGYPLHPDTVSGAASKRGKAYIHAPNVDMAGDDQIPKWFKDKYPALFP